MTCLRAISLNSWKNDGDYPARLDRIRDGLRPFKADIIGLQEAFAAPSLGLDSAAMLADELGLTATQLPLRHKPRLVAGQSVESSSGQALLSPWPVLASRSVPLESDPRDGERAALLVDLECAGQPVSIAVLHLTHLAGADALRRRQWQQIAQALPSDRPVLAMGDFNAPIEQIQPDQQGFRDGRIACGLPPRATLVGGRPDQCIDHILVRGAVTVRHWTTILDEAATAGSDHCGVMVDIVLD